MPRPPSDRLYDEYTRQTKLGDEMSQVYPELTKLYGVDALRNPTRDSLQKLIDKTLEGRKDLIGNKYSADTLRGIQDEAGFNAAKAYNQDVIKGENAQDFVNKFSKLHQIIAPTVGTHPDLENDADYDSDTNKIQIHDPNHIGILLHELGHAMTPEGAEERIASKDTKYPKVDTISGQREENGELFEPKDPASKDAFIKRIIQNKKIPEWIDYNTGQMSETNPQPHFGNQPLVVPHPVYNDYAIEKPLNDLIDESRRHGFESTIPEENPKFQALKSLFNK